MTNHKVKYRDLHHTMQGMCRQISDSLDYAATFVPRGTTPRQLFWLLKQHTVYKNDPPGVELLQSMPSMMENNYWGIPGAGDCDCFSITTAACCKVLGIPCRLVLVGQSPKAPSHVYCEVKDGDKWVPFDLVNTFYGETKNYRYLSVINLK
jgi:hypothetical protein